MILKIGLCFLVMKFNEISAIEINCDYSNTNDGYICKVENLTIESPNQKITKVNGEHVKGFSEVEEFYVGENQTLTYLPIGLNDHFPQLKKLYVQLSSLKYISKDDFYNLKFLKIIDFAGNQIETIPADVFSTLDQLEHLSLSNNKITNIFSSTFENLLKLQEIYLEDNQIEELDENLFKNNLELKKIFLSRNRFKIIGPKLVTQLMKLTKIEFSGDENCIKTNFDLISDNNSSLLTVENDLKALCSKPVEALIITQIPFDKDNLNQQLMNETKNINDTDVNLQQKNENTQNNNTFDLLTNSSQEIKMLKNKNLDLTKVVDELKKSLDDVKKQFNELQQAHDLLKSDETYKNEIQMLRNESTRNITLLYTEITNLKIAQTTTTTVAPVKDSISMKFSVLSEFLEEHSNGTLLLCSGCFNILLSILLIMSIIMLSKKSSGVVQNYETTLVMTEKRKSTTYSQ